MMDGRWLGRWVPGGLVTSDGLGNRCQVDAYVSPSGVMNSLDM